MIRTDTEKWLENIPNYWETIKAKYLFKNKSIKGYPDKEILSATQDKGVIPRSLLDGVVQVAENADLSNFKLVRKGDFVISLRSFQGGIELSRYEGISSPAYTVMTPTTLVQASYYKYLLKSVPLIDRLNSLVSGIRDGKNIAYDQFGEVQLPVPPIEEQQKIGAFLEYKVGKILELKNKLDIQRELLKEYRFTLINQAVTKGLDRNISMKDSGIEWLGEIPRNWEIAKLGYFAEINARIGWKGLKADEYVEKGYIFLATPNIKNREIDYENVNFITEERYLESPEIMLKEGDVLLAKDGSTLGTVNIIRSLPKKGTVNSSIAIIRPHEAIHSLFLRYYFESNYMRHIIQAFKDGMGVPHLFQKDVKKFKIVLPPLNEQIEISDFIDEKVEKIDASIWLISQQIQKLDEYRSSLITAAVTGQIDVSELSVSEDKKFESFL